MPEYMHERDKELLFSLFNNNPRAVMDVLISTATTLAKQEPEAAKTWKKVANRLSDARREVSPLYKEPTT